MCFFADVYGIVVRYFISKDDQKHMKSLYRYLNTEIILGRKEMFYLTTHSTHFIYGYIASDHSDSEKRNPLPPHRLLFLINSKDSFICTIPHTGQHIPQPLLHQA